MRGRVLGLIHHPSCRVGGQDYQLPLDPANAGTVLMVVGRRENVTGSGCYFLAAYAAAVYPRPLCSYLGWEQLVESLKGAGHEEL